MRLRIVPGKNFKIFVRVEDVTTKEDFELLEIVEKTVSRTEFKPFLKTFNKHISDSYLFEGHYFPVQFLTDVVKNLNAISKKEIQVLNAEIIEKDFIEWEEFDAWIQTLKFPDDIYTNTEEYEYQRLAAYLGVKNNTSRITVATSGGKTFITYLYCRYIFDFVFGEKKKILIVVPTKTLCNQLKKDFKHYDTFFERPFGVETIFSGAKRLLDADIVCGTFQSLSEYEREYFDDFGVFVCDELHRASAYSIRNEIFNKLYNCEFFFGMTGTPPEPKTLDYLHITSMFGSEVLVKEAWELIEAGVATPVKVSFIKLNYKNDKIHNLSRDLKLAGIKGTGRYMTEKTFLQSFKPRTKILAKLLNSINETSLILVNTVEYCQILYDFLTVECPDWEFDIIHGKISNREDILDYMRSKTEKYCLIATTGTMSTGISVKTLTNCYLVDGGKSQTRAGQSIGRLMRLFKTKQLARMFVFWDVIPESSFNEHCKVVKKYYENKKFPVKVTETTIESDDINIMEYVNFDKITPEQNI